jgi:hypothetical protein
MSEQKTTKKGKKAGGVSIESSTPIGQEEVQANWNAEQQQTSEPPDKLQPKRKTQDHKPLEPNQKLNPKRSINSRPD